MNESTASAGRSVQPDFAGVAWRPPSTPPSLGRDARADLLREMLERLENVTLGGQQYLMGKVLPLLRREAVDPSTRCRPGDLEVVRRSLDELEREASRLSPDPCRFSERARTVVAALALP